MLSPDRDPMTSRLEQLCLDKGLKMTEQRRVIARVLSDSADHPDVEKVYRAPPRSIRGSASPRSIAPCGCLKRPTSSPSRFRRRPLALRGNASDHHDHLIDLQSGRVVEFRNEEIEKLQRFIADQLAMIWSGTASNSMPSPAGQAKYGVGLMVAAPSHNDRTHLSGPWERLA